MIWNTFLGGSGGDFGYGIAVDGSGNNIYVAGFSNAAWGTPIRAYSGGECDAFVAKLGSNGSLSWHTFLGGAGDDRCSGIAVDWIGNYIHVLGKSSATWGSPARSYSSGNDAFAAKLGSDGSLTWNTFLGGSGDDYGQGGGIAVDGNGNVHVSGYSNATWGSPVRVYSSSYDIFVAKIPETPLLVKLKSFTTKIKNSSMALEWATESEIDNAGFNIWRSESENGVYEKVNNSLIPATGSLISGASYVYNDDNIKLEKKYCYKLEDIDTKGNSQFHKPTGNSPCFNVLLGDANGDGKIDLKDAAYILQITSNIRKK